MTVKREVTGVGDHDEVSAVKGVDVVEVVEDGVGCVTGIGTTGIGGITEDVEDVEVCWEVVVAAADVEGP